MVTIYLLKFKTLSYKKLHFSQTSASFLLNKVYNVLIKSPDRAAALISSFLNDPRGGRD